MVADRARSTSIPVDCRSCPRLKDVTCPPRPFRLQRQTAWGTKRAWLRIRLRLLLLVHWQQRGLRLAVGSHQAKAAVTGVRTRTFRPRTRRRCKQRGRAAQKRCNDSHQPPERERRLSSRRQPVTRPAPKLMPRRPALLRERIGELSAFVSDTSCLEPCFVAEHDRQVGVAGAQVADGAPDLVGRRSLPRRLEGWALMGAGERPYVLRVPSPSNDGFARNLFDRAPEVVGFQQVGKPAVRTIVA